MKVVFVLIHSLVLSIPTTSNQLTNRASRSGNETVAGNTRPNVRRNPSRLQYDDTDSPSNFGVGSRMNPTIQEEDGLFQQMQITWGSVPNQRQANIASVYENNQRHFAETMDRNTNVEAQEPESELSDVESTRQPLVESMDRGDGDSPDAQLDAACEKLSNSLLSAGYQSLRCACWTTSCLINTAAYIAQ